MDAEGRGFSFFGGEERSGMKGEEPSPVEGRDGENGGRCFELSWNEMFCLLGYSILCQRVFFKK